MIGRRKPLLVVTVTLVACVLLCDAEQQNQGTDSSVLHEQGGLEVDGKTVPNEENSDEVVVSLKESLDDDHNPTMEKEDELNAPVNDTVSEGGEGFGSGSANNEKDTGQIDEPQTSASYALDDQDSHDVDKFQSGANDTEEQGRKGGIDDSQASTSYTLNDLDSQVMEEFQSQPDDTKEQGSGGGLEESQNSTSYTLNDQDSQNVDKFQSQSNDTEEQGSRGGAEESQTSTTYTVSDQASHEVDEIQSHTNDTEEQGLTTEHSQPSSQEDSTAQGGGPVMETENFTTTSEFTSSGTGNDQTVPRREDPGEKDQSDRISSASSMPSPPEDKVHDPDYLDLDEPAPAMTVGASDNSQDQPPNEHAASATAGGATTTTTATTTTSGELDAKQQIDEDSKGSDETNRDKPFPSEDGKKPVEGSIANFLEKVKNEEPDLLAGHPPINNMTSDSVEPHGPATASPDLDPLEQPSEERQYGPISGTWGMTSNKRYADVGILGLLFNKNLVANASSRYNKIFEPIDGLVIPTLYSTILGGAPDEELGDSTVATPGLGLEGLADQRSVNTEFVEGLDDLDKFFEGVDPPDELDVGAAGSSIQDVLMGQTSKIIFKRVIRGWNYASGIFKACKTSLSNYLANEERKAPAMRMEHLVQARTWLVARAKDLFLLGKDLYESIFNDEEEAAGDEFLDYASDLQKKLQDMTNAKG